MIFLFYIKTFPCAQQVCMLNFVALHQTIWPSVEDRQTNFSHFFSIFRSNTTDEELGEFTKTSNPEEINIDEDFETDEEEEVEGKEHLI